MTKSSKFLNFLDKLQTSNNANLLESIKQGFRAVIEGFDDYIEERADPNGPKSGRFFIVPEVGEIQSPDEDTHLLTFEEFHSIYFFNEILPNYFHLSHENIEKLMEINRKNREGYAFRRGLVEVEPFNETDPDRIFKINVGVDYGKITDKLKEELIDAFNLQNVRDKLYFYGYLNVDLEMREEFNNIVREEKNKKQSTDVDYKQFEPLPALKAFEGIN